LRAVRLELDELVWILDLAEDGREEGVGKVADVV